MPEQEISIVEVGAASLLPPVVVGITITAFVCIVIAAAGAVIGTGITIYLKFFA